MQRFSPEKHCPSQLTVRNRSGWDGRKVRRITREKIVETGVAQSPGVASLGQAGVSSLAWMQLPQALGTN
jgi:hypothetical protein